VDAPGTFFSFFSSFVINKQTERKKHDKTHPSLKHQVVEHIHDIPAPMVWVVKGKEREKKLVERD